MTMLEDLISFIMILMSVLTPSQEVTLKELSKQENYPHVYVVSQEELAMAACGCPCDVGGAYIGIANIDGVVGHTIIMGGDPDGNMLNTPVWNAILFHEIDHVRQAVEGKYDFVEYMTEEEQKEHRAEMETEAYIHQNAFHMMYRLPPKPIDEHTAFSMAMAAGTPDCYPGYSPIPEEERHNALDLIMFYDQGMIDIYRKKWQ